MAALRTEMTAAWPDAATMRAAVDASTRTWLSAALWPMTLAQALLSDPRELAAPANENVVSPSRPAFRTASGFAVAEIIRL